MAKAEVWNQTKDILVVHFLGIRHVVQARLFIAQDDASPSLENAFEMLVSLRFFGAQLDDDSTQHFPLKNGPVCVNLDVTSPPTPVRGAIQDYHALDAAAKTLAPGAWDKSAVSIGFTLSGTGTVTLPLSQIVASIPSVGPALGLIAHLLPANVAIELSYPPISFPVHRDAGGKVCLPPKAPTPQWWT